MRSTGGVIGMGNDVGDRSWKSWARLMPPRRAKGDSRNATRSLVAAKIFALTDEERNAVADFVDAFEAKRSTAPIAVRLQTIALAILSMKRDRPEAWAP